MKKKMMVVGIVLSGFIFILGISLLVNLPVPYYQDFSVMYFTEKAFLNGIPVYSYPQQLEFIKAITPSGFTFHPYPYPPWYAIFTFYIGLLPIQAAARFWFFINLLMLFLSAWILTHGWKMVHRVVACALSLLFLPSLGLLVVGQYSAPVLLGVTLFLLGVRQKDPIILAVSLLLFTFKPHIGAVLFLAGVFWLFYVRPSYTQKVLQYIVIGGIALAGIGFVADRAWPVSYIQSLLMYQNVQGVQACTICVSPVVIIYRWFVGHASLASAGVVGLAIFILAGMLLFKYYANNIRSPFFLLGIAVLLTLLLVPYSLNYDYVLLLVPILLLARFTRLAWVAYIVPFGVFFGGRDMNILLPLMGCFLFVLVLHHSIDLTAL